MSNITQADLDQKYVEFIRDINLVDVAILDSESHILDFVVTVKSRETGDVQVEMGGTPTTIQTLDSVRPELQGFFEEMAVHVLHDGKELANFKLRLLAIYAVTRVWEPDVLARFVVEGLPTHVVPFMRMWLVQECAKMRVEPIVLGLVKHFFGTTDTDPGSRVKNDVDSQADIDRVNSIEANRSDPN